MNEQKDTLLGAKAERSIRTRARILPSSTSDVQAAIAAIQARTLSLREQQSQFISSNRLADSRFDSNPYRSFSDRRNDTDDSSISTDDESDQFLDEIANVIDKVAGKGNASAKNSSNTNHHDDNSLSSDSDYSSDDSLLEHTCNVKGMVSKATAINIGAFIDSLNENPIDKTTATMGDNEAMNSAPSEIEQIEVSEHRQEEISYKAQSLDIDDVQQLRITSSDIFPEYDQTKLEGYMNKASELGRHVTSERRESTVVALERILFYARKEKLPIIPVVDAFENELVDDGDFMATRFAFYVREAVKLVESDSASEEAATNLLSAATAANLDIYLLKDILIKPEKHIPFKPLLDPNEELPAVPHTDEMEQDKEDDEDAEEIHLNFRAGIGMNRIDKSGSLSNSSSDEQLVDQKQGLSYFEMKMQILAAMEQKYLLGLENSEHIPHLGVVKASKRILFSRVFRNQPSISPFRVNHWKLSTVQRSKYHPGFSGVDSKTLLNVAVQVGMKHKVECFEWETLTSELSRKKRLITSMNWFGKINHIRLNGRSKHPFSQPSMLVMKRLVYPKQWEEEWYTTWLTRKQYFNIPLEHVSLHFMSVKSSESTQSEKDRARFDMSPSEDEDEVYDTSIGKIITMRYRSGERMTRVHHNHTSFLSKSRWKRKYLP